MGSAKIHTGDTPDFVHIMRDDNDYIVPISSPITLQIKLRKPDGTILTRTAALVGDGTDGKMHYQTVVTDLNVQGDWSRQAYVKLVSGEWSGKLFKFTVNRKLG